MYYVNKTKILEKGIVAFPSLFIEGAAACGKSTVVNMFLEAHPEVHSDVFFMDKEAHDFELFQERLNTLVISEKNERYIVFENINRELTSDFYKEIAKFIMEMPENIRVFLISREKPARELLELLWKSKMGMVFQSSLIFTAAEVAQFVSESKTHLHADDVYRITGGWPGCMDVLVKLSEQLGPESPDVKSATKLLQRYEVQAYIQDEILKTLSEEEEEIMRRANICPWLSEKLCEEVWGMMWSGGTLKDLERKGLLLYNEQKKRWKIAPLFRKNEKATISQNSGKHLARWYEEHGAVEEALWCLDVTGCGEECRECVIRHFDTINFIDLETAEIEEWKGNIPELCYLRGMHAYLKQDFAGLRKEMQRVQKVEGKLADEVYLNLTFVDPEIQMEDWLVLLEKIGTKWAPIRLYHFTENANVFSTGWRELSGLFVCSADERKRRGQLLKQILGEKEWIGIQFAYADFVMETRQHDILHGAAWEQVLRIANDEIENLSWRYKVVSMYLLSKMYIITSAPDIKEQVDKLKESLRGEENDLCQKYLYAIEQLHAFWHSEEDKTTRWMRKVSNQTQIEITEANYYLLFLRVKGFLLLNQYDQAERIIQRLIPYLQEYRRTRILAEVLFQQAIVQWAAGKKGAALRSVIESFLFTGECRYVTFYINYGKKGKDVLEAYVDWHRNNEPGKWNKKKKYNYGNVLHMPMEDYLGVVLRGAKRNVKKHLEVEVNETVEKLTMMETIILQDINKGLTNAELCSELNLKLPTVKTHISNVYKKLDVNNRVQAIVRGKELGILK